MISRRNLLAGVGAVAAGWADIPRGACDCHVHIFGDPKQFPLAPARTYSPAPALVPELRALHRALGIERVVIVQPSIYGTDNSCTLDGIRQLGERARGVAVVDEKTPPAELDLMDRAGIRGIRVNLGTTGVSDPAVGRQRVKKAVEILGKRNWHIQIYTQLPMIAAIEEQLLAAPMPFVFDHFGGAQAALGLSQPGFDVLLRLLKSGKAYVKISAPYRSTAQAIAPDADYPDVAPFARTLIAANPQRILWGSDWPHPDTRSLPNRRPTDIAPRLPIDDQRVFSQLAVWEPDAAVRKAILVENPARLYRF